MNYQHKHKHQISPFATRCPGKKDLVKQYMVKYCCLVRGGERYVPVTWSGYQLAGLLLPAGDSCDVLVIISLPFSRIIIAGHLAA